MQYKGEQTAGRWRLIQQTSLTRGKAESWYWRWFDQYNNLPVYLLHQFVPIDIQLTKRYEMKDVFLQLKGGKEAMAHLKQSAILLNHLANPFFPLICFSWHGVIHSAYNTYVKTPIIMKRFQKNAEQNSCFPCWLVGSCEHLAVTCDLSGMYQL